MPKKTNKTTKKPSNDGALDVTAASKRPNTGVRPIIVTHKPMVEDPMLNKEVPAGTEPKKEPPKSLRKSLNIAPLDEANEKKDVVQAKDVSNTEDETVQEAEAAVEAATEEKTPEIVEPSREDTVDSSDTESEKPAVDAEAATSPDDEQAETKPDESEESDDDAVAAEDSTDESAAPEGGLVDELAKQAASKKQQQEEDKVAAAEREKLDELVAARTYYVPTTQVAKRRVKNVFLTLLILALLIAVGLNFAADVELIDLGINPLTDML